MGMAGDRNECGTACCSPPCDLFDGGGSIPPRDFWEGGGAFRTYSAAAGEASGGLRVIVRKSMVVRLTKGIVETYQLCNSSFKYSEALIPKQFFTFPHAGVLNGGLDNENSDLILSAKLVLVGSYQRYIVKEMLGQGAFGQVAKCWIPETNTYAAVKVIKNQPAYYQQALVEVSFLLQLNQKYDPDDAHHIVRIFDYFVYQHHLCISFELLGHNLFEVLKFRHYKGLPLSLVQEFSQQMLHALIVMKDAGIIHCDLKPENILLCPSRVNPTAIKVIDFGSACEEGRTIYSYIQSRHYRSPEVVLGYPYTSAIDMWSIGCIVAELFLGLPLFPGVSEFDLFKRMMETLGGQPPDYLLREAKNTSKFFKHVGSIHSLEDNEAHKRHISAYCFLTKEEYEARELKKPDIGKQIFDFAELEDIISNYPYGTTIVEEEMPKEKLKRLAFVDFLRGLLEFDPTKRWSPLQASHHPFVTGKPLTCPYKPLTETPHILVNHSVTVDRNPGGGYWLTNYLSPQVSNMNQGIRHISQFSPHFQMTPLSHGGSYGSFGSHGSYNDVFFPGSSYGDDNNNAYRFYSPGGLSGLNIQARVGQSILVASPDTRRRPQIPHGTGFSMSPAGNFGPMSLGTSPSQFMSISRGSPLGEAAMVDPSHRSWGHLGPMSVQSWESTSQHCQGQHGDGISYSHTEGNFQGHAGSPHYAVPASSHSSWSQQRGGNGFSSGFSTVNQNFSPSHPINPHVAPSSHSTLASSDTHENSLSPPDPGDWDPNYSDELLLQEDCSDVGYLASGITNGMQLGHSMDTAILMSGIGRYNHGSRLH